MTDLISINEATKNGIDRLRLPVWSMAEDHIKIDIIDKKPGPWVHLFSPANTWCNGRDPVNILITEMDPTKKEYLKYEGPLPETDEYKSKAEHFDALKK
ncbi:MAG: hypothetical protein KKD44_28370 [Proteobacteria bacterium]|nr:hypothetical protein [Pseudomonadota bacterium]